MLNAVVFWLRLGTASSGFAFAVVWLLVLQVFRVNNVRSRQSFARIMSRLTCRPLGLRLIVRGAEHIEQHSPCVYVANHQSYVDYPIAGAVFPGNAVVFGRDVGNVPIVGTLFRRTGNIPMESKVPAQAVAALNAAEREIVDRKHSVWIFAEGTRGQVAGKLGTFKRGAFRLALATGVPVVPVVISPLKPATDLRGRRLERRSVVITILQPVLVAGLSVADEAGLRERVQLLMQRVLDDEVQVGVAPQA